MVDPHTSGCPDPEVLAAYVDRGLSLAERARVDAHLASCPQCIALVAGVARTVAEVSALVPDAVVIAEATPLVSRRALAGAVAAAAAVLAIVAAPSLVRPWLERDTRLVNLVGVVGEHRSVLGRLTGGFPHAPLGVPSAGGQDGRTAGADRVQLTAGRIRESFGERETPSQLHALGVSQLLAGRYDDAAQSLLAASREQPANARYLSDVATVQLERARLGLRPDDLPRALAAADRAKRLDPSLKEARFNRALAFSALSLREQSTQAWKEYLKLDAATPWAREAQSYLAELAKATPSEAWSAIEIQLRQSISVATADEAVSTHVTEARKFIEDQLIPAWADAVIEGRDASVALERARVMSQAMMRVTGDALYVDAINAMDRAARAGIATDLARAHQQYAGAATLLAQDQYGRALPLLRDAKNALAAQKTPYAIRPALDVASIVYATGGYAESQQLLSDARATAQLHQYAYAEARTSWIQGLIAFVQGRLGDAQANYEDTLSTFTRIGDREQIAAAHTLLAGLFYYLGDDNQAWLHFAPALKGLDVTRSPKLRHALLSAAATSLKDSNPEAALAVQDATVTNAEAWGYPSVVAEALTLRASILASLGRKAEGERDLASAAQATEKIPAPLRSRLAVTALLTQSKLLRRTDPAAAVGAAKRAIAILEERRDRFPLARLELELAKANIAWGKTGEAELALKRGIEAFEAERASLSDEARASVRDEAWQLFETAAQIAIQRHDYERAFALAERARARSLAEARKIPSTRTLGEVQASLSTDEAILALNQFEDEVAIWVIKRDHVTVTTRKLTRDEAVRLVARHQDEIWRQSTFATASRSLYNELIRPAGLRLEAVNRLVVVPDTTYENVSFAALSNPESNRFLVEDFRFALAPSVNALVASRERTRAAATSSPVVFGGPKTTAADAAAVAGVYQSALIVTGSAATKAKFFESIQSRPAVHISVPVAISGVNPLLTRAVVADEPGAPHSGVIFGRDIATAGLTTNLVVIEEADGGSSNRGEGTLSMARAFMAAGVPAVVGTLPGADETATHDLLIAFHREIAAGVSAEQALQKVQRNAIEQNGRRLGAWSALVLYGSDR